MKKHIIFSLVICLTVACGDTNHNLPKPEKTTVVKVDWEDELQDQVKLLGHRNWIVVADEAYPLQSSPGITMLRSNADHVKTLKSVKDIIDGQGHIKPIVYLDKEIDYIDESAAPGITDYRKTLNEVLRQKNVQKVIHDDIISMLDKASKQFNIVVIKTDFTIPYTSVFFQLDCKYWDSESETHLRDKMNKN
ncbi:RbsD/FucU domain-containing protein [Zobellia uliginosa]|uniref:RbsD/FucU domain-containing protein n=1 Tax=Zobellia uliginosa TaxID=143224 RepID=UPI0026E1AD10|nr:RbsD/FucU domain-containing protein [Zobellia uliginosa]MDO6516548.1 RbsD/FucU domain-containing protein [Zobellia uliginosa]